MKGSPSQEDWVEVGWRRRDTQQEQGESEGIKESREELGVGRDRPGGLGGAFFSSGPDDLPPFASCLCAS